jgi:MFS family permease
VSTPNQTGQLATGKPSIFEGVTVYHWLVLLLASCGWLFDCMGQRIFVLAREPALQELLGASSNVDQWGRMATFILMVGWATGGILFGMMSDKYGRVKAMVATLVAYTIFSGLSGLARNGVEFLTVFSAEPGWAGCSARRPRCWRKACRRGSAPWRWD